MGFFPRWLQGNAYQELSDFVYSPELGTYPSSDSTWNSYSISATGGVPTQWVLTPAATVTGAVLYENVFQKYLESFTAELSRIKHSVNSLKAHLSGVGDVSDLSFVWVVTHTEQIKRIEVKLSDGSWKEIQRFDSFSAAAYHEDWSWIEENRQAVIFNLDLRELSSVTRSGSGDWQFIEEEPIEDSGLILYEHPESKTWIPIHPLTVREDGWLGFYNSSESRVRIHYESKLATGNKPLLRINGAEEVYPERTSIWNSVDEAGLEANLYRRDGETNRSLQDAYLSYYWFTDQTFKGVQRAVASQLRLTELSTVSKAATSFTLPASSTGFAIRNYGPFTYVTERLHSNPAFHRFFLTKYTDISFASFIYDNFPVLGTISSTGILLDTKVDWERGVATMRAKLPLYTQVGSSVIFSDNVNDQGADYTVLNTFGVRVSAADANQIRKSFLKTKSVFKWQSREPTKELKSVGLAVFY